MPANHYFWYLYVVCHEKNNKVSSQCATAVDNAISP